MLQEFSAREVTLRVLEQLERRRPEIAGDDEVVRAEVEAVLAPVRTEYLEAELPPPYIDALCDEVRRTVPSRWRAIAAAFSALERANYGVWRGGDPIARVVFVGTGLVAGGLILWAPFIPIWEKWVPFALALGAFFLPELQRAFHRRRYARALGEIAVGLERAQPALDARLAETVLLPPGKEGP